MLQGWLVGLVDIATSWWWYHLGSGQGCSGKWRNCGRILPSETFLHTISLYASAILLFYTHTLVLKASISRKPG